MNTPARDLLEVGLPGTDIGFGACDGHGLPIHSHGKDAMPLGKGSRHDLGDRRDVDLQRVDLDDPLICPLTEPGQECRHVQDLSRGGKIREFLFGEEHQGVNGSGRQALQSTQIRSGNTPVREQPLEQFEQR